MLASCRERFGQGKSGFCFICIFAWPGFDPISEFISFEGSTSIERGTHSLVCSTDRDPPRLVHPTHLSFVEEWMPPYALLYLSLHVTIGWTPPHKCASNFQRLQKYGTEHTHTCAYKRQKQPSMVSSRVLIYNMCIHSHKARSTN